MCPCKYGFIGGVFLPFDSKNGPQAELMESFKKTNLSAAKDPGRGGGGGFVHPGQRHLHHTEAWGYVDSLLLNGICVW